VRGFYGEARILTKSRPHALSGLIFAAPPWYSVEDDMAQHDTTSTVPGPAAQDREAEEPRQQSLPPSPTSKERASKAADKEDANAELEDRFQATDN
jgi:hypothetical protein